MKKSNPARKGSFASVYRIRAGMVLRLLVLSALLGVLTSLFECASPLPPDNSAELLIFNFRSSIYINNGSPILYLLSILPIIISGLPLIGYIKDNFLTSCIYVIPRTNRTSWFLKHTCVMSFYSFIIAAGYVVTNISIFALCYKTLINWPDYIYMSVWIFILYVLFTVFFVLSVNVLCLKLRPSFSLVVFIIAVMLPSIICKSNQERGIKMIISVLDPLSNFTLHVHNLPRAAELGSTAYPFFTPAFSLIYFFIIIGLLAFAGVRIVNKMDLMGRK